MLLEKAVPNLPSIGANTNATVSGFSSGGYMTAQMQVIHSDLFKGAGIVAGGPYDCVNSVEKDGDYPAAIKICT